MTDEFELVSFDPCPVSAKGLLESSQSGKQELMAIDIQAKYLFLDEDGDVYHEYPLPANADVHNTGGYVGKLIQYRDPALLQYFRERGVSQQTLISETFPILATRSPQLDLHLLGFVEQLRAEAPKERVSVFDLGCTVGEHWDLLDTMLKAKGDEGAAATLAYCGLDKSTLLLTVGRILHHKVDPEHFKLIQAEGTDFEFEDEAFDLSLTVGVVNHVANPHLCINKLLHATRYASVLAIWVTEEEEGFWTTIHSGLPFYFFTKTELLGIAESIGRGRFHVLDYIPEEANTQERSYIGLGAERIKKLGCYLLVYTNNDCTNAPLLT